MKIYILEGTRGSYEDRYTFKISAHLTKELAEERLRYYENFIPPYYCDKSLHRACCYELVKLGLMYDWRDVYEDAPFLDIDEVDMELNEEENNNFCNSM